MVLIDDDDRVMADTGTGSVVVAAVEPRLIAVPLARPVRMSGEEVATAENLVVRVVDDQGHDGWGEAASAPMMTGETGPGLLAAARFIGPRLVGQEVAVGDATARTEPLMFHNHGAKAAVRMALLDLLARREGRPLCDLLGGRRRDRAAGLVLLSGRGAAEIEDARRLVEAGVRALKVKIGLDGVASDLARAEAVRDAVGPEVRISADANGAFDRDAALEFMRGAEGAGLDFVEQPVPATISRACGLVRRSRRCRCASTRGCTGRPILRVTMKWVRRRAAI